MTQVIFSNAQRTIAEYRNDRRLAEILRARAIKADLRPQHTIARAYNINQQTVANIKATKVGR